VNDGGFRMHAMPTEVGEARSDDMISPILSSSRVTSTPSNRDSQVHGAEYTQPHDA